MKNKMNFYDEQTLVEPASHIEVFGQDGWGWYTYEDDAKKEIFKKFSKISAQNPLFIRLKDCTKKSLNGLGFVTIK